VFYSTFKYTSFTGRRDDDLLPSASSSSSSSSVSEAEEETEDPRYIIKIRRAVHKVFEGGKFYSSIPTQAMLIHVIPGMGDAVQWIKRCLTRTADDREEGLNLAP
jgi:hypothetical protein